MSAPLRVVDPRGAPEPTVNLKPDMTWWQKTLAGIAAMFATAFMSFVGSHWGGVTNDQLTKALGDQEQRLGKRIDDVGAKLAKDGDEMKRYVDAKTTTIASPKKPKKTPVKPTDSTP